MASPLASDSVRLVITVSLEGMIYTDAKGMGSLLSESTTVAVISLILPVIMLSLIMNCPRATCPANRHTITAIKNLFIRYALKEKQPTIVMPS